MNLIKTKLWDKIKERVKKDIKRDVGDFLGMKVGGNAISSNPVWG